MNSKEKSRWADVPAYIAGIGVIAVGSLIAGATIAHRQIQQFNDASVLEIKCFSAENDSRLSSINGIFYKIEGTYNGQNIYCYRK